MRASAGKAQPGKPKFLVVDDDPGFRDLLSLQLRREFIVWPAADGLQAHAKARQAAPDAMVLDLKMPGWDGFQTLRAFRESDELRHIPILMLTGDASRETVTRAIEAGVDDYVLKEGHCGIELARRIRRLLARTQLVETR